MKYTVSVEFCMMWNFAPKAVSLTDDILDYFKGQVAEVKLVTSSGGVFEVVVNGETLHSKKETGAFPKSEDVIKKMEAQNQ